MNSMKLSDLKPGQCLSINGVIAEYIGIKKVRIPNFGKVEKRVFKEKYNSNFKYFNINEGTKTLESENIKLIKSNE